MLSDIIAAGEIFIVCDYTNMRRSINSLCAIVQDRLHIFKAKNIIPVLREKMRPAQMLIRGDRRLPAPLHAYGSPGAFPIAEKT